MLKSEKYSFRTRLLLAIKKKGFGSLLLVSVGLVYIVIFLFIPLIFGILRYTNLNTFNEGLISGPFSMLFRNRLIKSIRVAAQVTAGSLVLGYPVAYYLAKITTARKQTVVMLITLPLFLSFLVRTYSWYYIFGLKGVISRLLVWIGVINQPISFLFKESTVFIGLLNWAIIFMVIPIYSAVEKIDVNLLEQAKNLGANEMQTFKEITLPLSLPGVASGCIMTFILSFGSFITPAILGGPGDKMIANLISLMFLNLNNWPMGMTFSVILTIFSLVMMYIYNKLIGLDTLLEALG